MQETDQTCPNVEDGVVCKKSAEQKRSRSESFRASRDCSFGPI